MKPGGTLVYSVCTLTEAESTAVVAECSPALADHGFTAIDAPVDEQARRVRADQTPLFMNNVDVGTGSGAPVS